MQESKCTCGHNNPVGTVLCEYCGKLLDENQSVNFTKVMRYEGRSRKSYVSRLWRLFSSVRFAVLLILITLVASSLGTILPQERFLAAVDKLRYYQEEYGLLGQIFYTLGLTRMYDSWWFFTLILLIGISLVVCSLDRVVPLYRALYHQRVIKSLDFIQRQRISYIKKMPMTSASEQVIQSIEVTLKDKGYNIRRDGDAILAEKGLLSRFGPYINHIGLLLALLGILLRYVPGWHIEEMIWLKEGERAPLLATGLYIENKGFTVDFHPESNIPKKFQTDIAVYDSPEGIHSLAQGSTLVNSPFKHDDFKLFQQDYRLNVEPLALTLKLISKADSSMQGKFQVRLDKPEIGKEYTLSDTLSVTQLEYYPDFFIQDGQPASKSNEPNKPAFIFDVHNKQTGKHEKYWVIAGENMNDLVPENQHKILLDQLHMVHASGLMLSIDKSLPLILIGGIIFLIGVVIGTFWQHRRIWLYLSKDNMLYLGAHTNKNWYAFIKEVESIKFRYLTSK